MKSNLQAVHASGYSLVETGELAEWSQHAELHPAAGRLQGKLFLKQVLQLTGTEISLNSLPAGGVVPFVHSHQQNEEVFAFLTGEGEMLLDGERVAVRAGSVVRIDPAVARSWRNTGTEELTYLVIQAKAGSLEQWTMTDGVSRGGNPWV